MEHLQTKQWIGLLSGIMVGIILFIPGCATTSQTVQLPVFRTEKSVLVKEMREQGDQIAPGDITDLFSSDDKEIISYVVLKDVSGGVHNLRWEWYDPQGKLYDASQDYPLIVSQGKYIERVSAWHKISVKGDKAQSLLGKWTVNIYFDKKCIAYNTFALGAAASALPVMLSDVDMNIPQTSVKNPDAVAVVIGNRYYRSSDIPEVTYADNDARVMKDYLIKTLGYKDANIIYKLDATKAEFEQIFGIKGNHAGKLNEYIRPEKSDVFIYYSGHGAPDPDTMQGYFIPSDCDSSRYSLNGYPLDVFYENLSKLRVRSLTIVLDACFSGGTNSGKPLLKSASPFGIKVVNPAVAKGNTICMTSSEGDQISSWYDEKRHGLFTYVFLKGLGGAADTNKDRILSYEELYQYVSDRTEGVPYWARRLHQGRTQTPTIQGIYVNKTLVRYE